VEGEVDMATAPTLVECFDRVMADPVDLVIVDLAGVTFLDSSGIASLVRAQRQFQGAGRDFCVRNPTPMVQRVLRITGVDDLLM
jgi:anti-anti-sigma factor